MYIRQLNVIFMRSRKKIFVRIIFSEMNCEFINFHSEVITMRKQQHTELHEMNTVM